MCLAGHEVSPLAFLHSRKRAESEGDFYVLERKRFVGNTHEGEAREPEQRERASVLEPGYSPLAVPNWSHRHRRHDKAKGRSREKMNLYFTRGERGGGLFLPGMSARPWLGVVTQS